VPAFSELSPTAPDYVLGDEWGPGQTTGTATGKTLQPAGGIVLPPTPSPSSSSGCTSADFSGFVPGNIALIQRGTCNFGVKVLNAKAAGASGVVIFNEGNPGRTGLQIGSMSDANGTPFIPDIPVAFTTFDRGNALYNEYKAGSAPRMTLSVPALVKPNTDDYNVIAESKGGDKNHVLAVDAHLDAIYGAGILDNGTGSVAILDIAQKMKNVTPTNKLRFIWFGGEELGLLGSGYYVNNLTPTDASHIGYDLDADVFGTPNYIIGILDPAAPDGAGQRPAHGAGLLHEPGGVRLRSPTRSRGWPPTRRSYRRATTTSRRRSRASRADPPGGARPSRR
jgi:Zn-dependent M28 family amino/carboxypeptidase